METNLGLSLCIPQPHTSRYLGTLGSLDYKDEGLVKTPRQLTCLPLFCHSPSPQDHSLAHEDLMHTSGCCQSGYSCGLFPVSMVHLGYVALPWLFFPIWKNPLIIWQVSYSASSRWCPEMPPHQVGVTPALRQSQSRLQHITKDHTRYLAAAIHSLPPGSSMASHLHTQTLTWRRWGWGCVLFVKRFIALWIIQTAVATWLYLLSQPCPVAQGEDNFLFHSRWAAGAWE